MNRRKAFTRDEIVLCIYAARYDIADIGGIDAIHALRSRSRSSIRMKIQNIVAMCDEVGISRSPDQDVLTGLPAGESGRRKNWEELSEFRDVPRDDHLQECKSIIASSFAWPGEISDGSQYREGSRRQVTVNAYERDPLARRKCLEYYGPTCVVCGFSFLAVFGPDAEGFIHVHHLIPLSEIATEYTVNPINDLRPVCPNCHAVIHLGGRTRSIDEVREMLQNSTVARE
ncbi:MAG: HNH endonuclease [Planctomycetaceae bacterium]